ncbi:MAG: hypothetical protein OEM02_12845 [Desulfobulbaceae bacterium]|nr:hypothetical protein [Desulfobulbaceae bacterium]
MSISQIWYDLFCRLLDFDSKIFIGFELVSGGGGFRFLPDKDCFNDEGYSTETEQLSYLLIEKIRIPESYKQGSAQFRNDIDVIFQIICKIKEIAIKYKEQECGPMKGRFLEITISSKNNLNP